MVELPEPSACDERRARAWLKHNVEEVGKFEYFLPELFAREHGRATERTYSIPT